MKIIILLIPVILSACFVPVYGMNYDDAYRQLMNRYGTFPYAGESPDQFQRRVAESRQRATLLKDFSSAKAQLADAVRKIGRLEIQLRMGMRIPEDETKEAEPLAAQEKTEMLRELVKFEDTRTWLASRCRNMAEALLELDARADRKQLLKEIEDALDRQRNDIRRDWEWEKDKR
jgi:hypothetical protein